TLPLTINGKLDTTALPPPQHHTHTDTYHPPTTPTEEILADIYAQVLGLDHAGIHDSFFELGGDSLSAMRVVAAIGRVLDVRLGVRTLFDAPTIAELTSRIGTQRDDLEPLA
ncbi:hypothetical protein JDV09_26405, partial [Mycobacterium sp. Y57]|uniref:phosphopantetheine-binding protein n=1 Tax=Mycolicibacterium xanthum TaxID=2796469 RepID=UPI001C859AD7